jgi:hypothetical protein
MPPIQPARGEQDPRFQLDPSRMPQRLELDLPEELLEQLMRQAERSHRSLPELIAHILSQSCAEIVEDA